MRGATNPNDAEIVSGGYDKLLLLLGRNEHEAARAYKKLREKLLTYFECRRISPAEDHADEVMHRIAAKAAAGEAIEDINRYAIGIARFVRLESFRSPKTVSIDDDPGSENFNSISFDPALAVQPDVLMDGDDTNDTLTCLRKCLDALGSDNRELLLAYYETDEGSGKHKDHRRRLAEKHGKSAGALQKQICLLRQKVSGCTRECAGKA
jgi:DNA-directed RNA polymerase specialized sigma24 family protein